MSSLFKQFGTDAKKEQEGVRVTYAANEDGSLPTFIIARRSRSNTAYRVTMERETRPYRRQIELETLDAKTADEINMRVFAQSLLLGWENVQNTAGQKMEYTLDNAITLFKLLPDLFDDLNEKAGKATLFVATETEEAAKN